LYCIITVVPATYTVTLNRNNGSGGTSSVTATFGSPMPSATAPTQNGYTFQGYFDTSASSGGTQYYTATMASARNWDKAQNATLWARWTENASTVTPLVNGVIVSGLSGSTGSWKHYKITVPTGATELYISMSGGTSGDADLYVRHGAQPTLSLWDERPYKGAGLSETVTINNPTAGDWYISIYADSAYTGVGLLAEYKMPSVSTYTVTLNPNNGSGGTASISVKVGDPMPSATAPIRDGYTFQGYFDTSATSGGTQYYTSAMASARNWDKAQNATLWARWQAAAPIGSTWYVNASRPSDSGDGTSWATAKRTIQAAVDLAVAGNTVIVTNGTYAPISTANKAITIQSVNGAAVTIINGGGTQCCAMLAQSLFSSATHTVLSGFTLTNGWTAEYGGGAWGGTLNNCILTGNTADFGGGAYDNVLNNCVLTGNTALSGGGADYSVLNNCTLTGNTATFGGGAHSSVLNNCLLTGNTAGLRGGGAYESTLNNCTVAGNTSDWNGGGVWGSALNSSIAWDNVSGSGTSDNYYFEDSDVLPINYTCTTPMPAIGTGNITTNPLFVNAAGGDFRLQAGSPCVNKGSNAHVVGAFDLDGNPRIQGGTVDMGAYEYGSMPTATYTVTLDRNGGSGGSASVSATVGSPMPSATAPTRDGYTFQGYFDTSATSGGTQYYTATMASAHNWDKAQNATLWAHWTANAAATYTVTLDRNEGSGGSASVSVKVGDPMPSATAPTRDGYTFQGYFDTSATSGGTQYYTAAMASARNWDKAQNATLWARWAESLPEYLSNPFLMETFADPTVSTAYDGFLYDEYLTICGTFTLSMKVDKKGNWSFSAKATLQNETTSFSGKLPDGPDLITATNSKRHECVILVTEDRFFGDLYIGDNYYQLDGARNIFADKKDWAAQGRLNTLKGLYNVALLSLYDDASLGYVSLSVGNLGAVKIAGKLEDGTSVSGSAKLLAGLSEDGWYAIALHCPLYSKKGFIGGLLWLDPIGKVIRVDTDHDWYVDWLRPVDGLRSLDVLGGYFGTGKDTPTVPQGLKFSVFAEHLPSPAPHLVTGGTNPDGWVTAAIPWRMPVTVVNGTKLSLPKGVKPKKISDPPDVFYSYIWSDNPSEAKISYTAKTGVFKGSLKMYYEGMNPSKSFDWETKIISASYTGVMVPDNGALKGFGTGAATINKLKCVVPVVLEK